MLTHPPTSWRPLTGAGYWLPGAPGVAAKRLMDGAPVAVPASHPAFALVSGTAAWSPPV